MSVQASMDQAYASFLASSELATWITSLRPFERLVEEPGVPGEARPIDYVHGMIAALYAAWLSARCGREESKGQARMLLEKLSARAAELPAAAGEAKLIQVVIAASSGYSAVASRLAKGMEETLPAEIVVLMMPGRAVSKAAGLKRFVLEGAGVPFAPAVYFYGAALLDRGYQSDTEKLLNRFDRLRTSSLIIDLRGQLLELAGLWKEARDEYARSEWASHAYRRAVCDLILGEPIERLSESGEELTRRFVAGMLDFSGETDRAGVVRSASFVRACRWSGFDNWLVHFELGRLAFQRRRHSEAEKHLAAAARTAPERFRFPVRSLRFTNLTWLGNALDVEMRPEVMVSAFAALQEPASENQRAHIRTWFGKQIPGVLDPVLASEDDYEKGQAHAIRGDEPEAIQCWCSCIGRSYVPRALFGLLRFFASKGFEKTASCLAAIVADEADDSFFDLLELAEEIAAILERPPSSSMTTGLLQERLERVEARLEKLVESEFQNAIRAFHYFLRLRPAQARRMLSRSEALAEGSEEHLRLAIARRKVGSEWGDPRSLAALQRAESQSEDRFERFLIARELVKLGQLARARAILTAGGGLSNARDLTPIEYVLALGCATVCFEDGDRARLEVAARETLRRDVESGRLGRFGESFLKRLNEHLQRDPLELVFPESDGGAEATTSGWATFIEQLGSFKSKPDSGRELRLLTQQIDRPAGTSPFARLALWGLHLERFETQLEFVERLRPTVGEDETPIARDLSPNRARAQTLARLWRAQVLAQEPAEAANALGPIRDFLADERQLAERWEQLRDEEAAEPSEIALSYARQGAGLLHDIRAQTDRHPLCPAFLNVDQAIIEDTNDLAAQLEERAASLRRRVPV